MTTILHALKHGLIVSCQAEGDDPFNKPEYVALFARAAEQGGACAVRACNAPNIRAIKQAVRLPVIGIVKGSYPDGSVLITADFPDVEAIIGAGADIVALDATDRTRPNGLCGHEYLAQVKARCALPIMADVASLEEGQAAEAAGADLVGTTLAGYMSPLAVAVPDEPDWKLLEGLVRTLRVPVVLEGRVWSSEHARRALDMGCFAVVVGTAITRPRLITQRFVAAMTRETLASASKPRGR